MHPIVHHSIHYRLLENIFLFLFTGAGFCLVEIGLLVRTRRRDKGNKTRH